MYVILVKVPMGFGFYDGGFFTRCYKASATGGEKGIWIGFTKEDDEWVKIKQFKTLKAAENKLKFLEKKQEENGHMWNWKLSIEKILKED